jgi:hypothetical protein
MLSAIPIEETDVFRTSSVGSLGGLYSLGERYINNVGYSDHRGFPATTIDATVKPIKTSIGTCGLGDLLYLDMVDGRGLERELDRQTCSTAGTTGLVIDMDESIDADVRRRIIHDRWLGMRNRR